MRQVSGSAIANPWPFELPRSGRDAISFAVGDVDSTLFREYDVRGTIQYVPPDSSYPLNEFVANRIGRAFGTFLAGRDVGSVVVGFDARSYSEPIANALVLGLLSTGARVTLLGLTTTPTVYFAQHHLGGVAGVSVTASHNPNGWAGFKLSDRPSVTLGPKEIEQVHTLVDNRAFATGEGAYAEHSVTAEYASYLATLLKPSRPLKVVLDGGNSIAGPIGEMALVQCGHEVVTINRELDWTFPNHEPDPETVEAREQIQRAVLAEGADIGISLDGDGDRLGVTDRQGNIVWSDRVLAILARDALSRHPGAPIVFDVKCSRAVADVIRAAGGEPVMWMTGHSHIKSKMREISAPFAGERSGHFFDAGDYYGYDDAIYSALRFLKIVADSGRTVDELVAEMPHYESSPTMQADCADRVKYRVVDEFAEYAQSLGARELVRINGVRAEFDDGWLLVRASSNLPALVMVAEAQSKERLDELYRVLREGLDRFDEVDRDWSNDPWATKGT
jgi:phosphomannomutase / phosphoglucomutase